MESVRASARLAATRQSKAMRSASLSHVMQSNKARWKRASKISVISDSKKLVTARYLQLKSGHAITGKYLLRIKKAQNACYWWCNSSRQAVGHLLAERRRWRRERDVMLADVHATGSQRGETCQTSIYFLVKAQWKQCDDSSDKHRSKRGRKTEKQESSMNGTWTDLIGARGRWEGQWSEAADEEATNQEDRPVGGHRARKL